MKHNTATIRQSWLLVFTTLIILAVVSGCSVKLISSYDEKMDRSVTELQKKVETFFVTVESQAGLPECTYENHKRFYQGSKVSISAIEVRARAIPKNEITIRQVELLKSSLESLEKLHKLGCLSVGQIAPLRSNFNSSFTSILKVELAKKRGEEK